MSVKNRIKILNVNSCEDAEYKVNDFLANNPNIAELVHIDYRLEYNFVIIEYYVFSAAAAAAKDNNNNNNDGEIILEYNIMSSNPFLVVVENWLKLWNPYYYLKSFVS